MNLEINHKEIDDTRYMYLNGEIDAFTAPKLKEELFPLVEQAGNEVFVDLKGINYIDSTGLGIFVGALKATHSNGSKMTLINLSDRVYRLFKITGLDEVIDIIPENKEGAR